MNKEMHFSVKSGLKDIIGRDLILDDNIAIFELVKNSYDAHAKNVIITFENNKIIIADNGKGMSLADLENKWLSVAWSAKSDGTEDLEEKDEDGKKQSYRDLIQEKRHYAGAKGIGRFSVDRLGEKLVLTTCKIGQEKLEQLQIAWDKFNKKDESNKIIKQDFEKIPVIQTTLKSYHIPFPCKKKHGTILEIEEATNWDRKKIKGLKHSLEKLINPFSETNEFCIKIVCEREKVEDEVILRNGKPKYKERDKINGDIKNSIVEVIKLKTTRLEVIVNNKEIISKLYDRDSLIYHIEEENCFNPFIEDLHIDLYFLNRSAKTSFSYIMGVQPVQYGSVFLFKNGFRVQPYGELGDDSWKLDSKHQQGYNRYLSTRDLFGRIDIVTDNNEQFKEVSSRDGGLKKTEGYSQLYAIFKKKAVERLQRYVVGVLWGEGFLRERYFNSKEDVYKYRALLKEDKDSGDYSVAKSNIGSKLDFTQLLKGLTDDENVTIKDFNKDLLDFVNEDLGNVEEKFITDLKKIAKATKNEEIWKRINQAEKAINRIKQEREEARQRALEAEQKARKEEEMRENAERKAREEEEKRRKAQLETAKKEKERLEAENAKLIAEKKAQEEEQKRRKAELETERKEKERLKAENEKLKAELKAKKEEEKRKEIEEAKKKVDDELEQEKKQGIFQRSLIGREKEQILGLQHQINHSSSRIKNNIKSLLKHIQDFHFDEKIQKYIAVISLESAKIESISNFVTNANFDLKTTEIKQDIILFIEEYIREIYLPDTPILNTSLKINILNTGEVKHVIEFRPLEITTFIDNFIQNAEKAGATEICFEFKTVLMNRLQINISNNGKVIKKEHIDKIFDLGFTTTKGSGVGLFHINTVVKRLCGKIDVFSEDKKGVTFKIEI